MSRYAFVPLALFTMILTGVLAGCSDNDIENESVSPTVSGEATDTVNHDQAGAGDHNPQDNDDGPMDHESEAGHHGGLAANEGKEGMAHENAEPMDMQGASHWNAPAEAATLVNPVVADAISVKRGRAIYAMSCISCHGENGRGDGPIASTLDPKPADLAIMAPMHPDGDFFWKIGNGRGPMPSWKNTLNENQIWDLVNYIKSLGDTASSETDSGGNDGHDHSHM